MQLNRTVQTRWAAIGAAVAVSLGAGGVGFVRAATSSEAPGLTPITACRLVDTRPDFQVGPRTAPLGPAETYTVAAEDEQGECDLPAAATALALNVTAIGATLDTYLTFWDEGELPNASSLNPSPGQPPTPNAVTVPLAADGTFEVYNFQGEVDLVIDVVGYHQSHHHDDRYYTKDTTYSRREVSALLEAQRVLAWSDSHGNGLRTLGVDTYTTVETIDVVVPVNGLVQITGSGWVTNSLGGVTSISCLAAVDGVNQGNSTRSLGDDTGSCGTNHGVMVAAGEHTIEFKMRSSNGEGFVQPSNLDVLFVPADG